MPSCNRIQSRTRIKNKLSQPRRVVSRSQSMPVRSDTFTLGLVQMHCDADPDANLERAVAGIRRAAGLGGQIICLQELFRSQYFCQQQNPALFDLAEAIPGPSSEKLAAVAREAGVVVVASLFERRTAGVYHNTAAV